MAILYIHTENSKATLIAQLRKMGYPSLEKAGVILTEVFDFDSWRKVREKAFYRRIKRREDAFIGESPTEVYDLSVDAGKLGIDTIVIDTISSLNRRLRSDLRRRTKAKLSWDDWDKIGNELEESLVAMVDAPCRIIFLCHIADKKDEDSGIIYERLNLNGQPMKDYPNQFDYILKAECVAKTKGVHYVWKTQSTVRYDCKDRSDLLEPAIPQDFQLIFNAHRESGNTSPEKILIFGNSGTGKTYSLRTLFADKTPQAPKTGDEVQRKVIGVKR